MPDTYRLGTVVELDTGERLRLAWHWDNDPACPNPWEIVRKVDESYHWDTRTGEYVRAHAPRRLDSLPEVSVDS